MSASSHRQITLKAFLSGARPYTGEMDLGLLKPMFRSAFLNAHNLRYPEHSRHGEDFLLIVEALLKGGEYHLVGHVGYYYTTRDSGMSRTRIDYPKMATHSANLLRDPRIRTDKHVVRLVRQRVSSIRRLAAERKFDQGLAVHGIGRVIYQATTDPWLAFYLAKRTAKKMVKNFDKLRTLEGE